MEEEVYINIPLGFRSSTSNNLGKLRKSLHGVKQAPKQWFAKLSSKFAKYDFVAFLCRLFFVYIQRRDVFMTLVLYVEDVFMTLVVYVEGLVLTGNDPPAYAEFRAYLNHCFHIKDLWPLKHLLGIKVARGPKGLVLSQRKYALEIIDECGLLGSKPVDFPMETNHKLASATEKKLDDPTQYRRLVGALIYLIITWPNLYYTVRILLQFMQDPQEEHIKGLNVCFGI